MRNLLLPLLLVGVVAGMAPASVWADEANIQFYATPSTFNPGEPMLLEVWAQDPQNPGNPLPGFSGTSATVTGFWHDGNDWVSAFPPFPITISDELTTEFGVTFEESAPVKIIVVSSMANSAELLAQCVPAEPVATEIGIIATDLDTAGSWSAGESICFTAQVEAFDFANNTVLGGIDYSGPIFVQHFAAGGLGEWNPEIQVLQAVAGQVTVNLQVTSVAHCGIRIWIDPSDWAAAQFSGSAPSTEKYLKVMASSPAHIAVVMGDLPAIEANETWMLDQLGHVAVLDQWGNHCPVEEGSELTLFVSCEEVDLISVEATPDFSRMPPADPFFEGETVPEPQGSAPLRDEDRRLCAKMPPRASVWYAHMRAAPAQVTIPFTWRARSSYYTSLGLPVQFHMTMPVQSTGIAHLSFVGATLHQPVAGTLSLTAGTPTLLPQAGSAIAVQNSIDAKVIRTSSSVGIYEDLGSLVSYKPAAVTTWHHGGAVYCYGAIPDWYYPSELPHRGSPSTAHNTYRDATHIGIVDNGDLIDHLLMQGVRERAARAVRAEVTYDATKLGGLALQVTWDVSLEYHVLAYGFHSSVAGGYSHSGGAVEMFVSGNLAGKRLETKAGVDKNNALAASSVTVGVGPLSIPIPIPQTSGNDTDGSKTAQPGTLIYTETGANTLFTVGAISGQVHRAKSAGGWFQYETDHGLGSNLTASRIEVTIKIGGNPSFLLGKVMFAP